MYDRLLLAPPVKSHSVSFTPQFKPQKMASSYAFLCFCLPLKAEEQGPPKYVGHHCSCSKQREDQEKAGQDAALILFSEKSPSRASHSSFSFFHLCLPLHRICVRYCMHMYTCHAPRFSLFPSPHALEPEDHSVLIQPSQSAIPIWSPLLSSPGVIIILFLFSSMFPYICALLSIASLWCIFLKTMVYPTLGKGGGEGEATETTNSISRFPNFLILFK